MTKPKTYKIRRFYVHDKDAHERSGSNGAHVGQAQAHCRDPKTHKAGEWFDGYVEE